MSENTDVRASKRDQFNTPAPSTNANRIIAAAAIVLVAAVAFLFVFNRTASGTTLKAKNGVVRIPVAKISSNAAHFEYASAQGKIVKFFVVRAGDGKIRAAADACDVCYAAKLGYQQDGNDMVCRKCSQRFPSELINEVSGGCNPAGLPQRVEGNDVVFNASDLEARAVFF